MRQYFTVAAVTRLSNTCDQASHSGGFASMDADKQREIASQGEKHHLAASSLAPRAKEAGRKGEQASREYTRLNDLAVAHAVKYLP